MDASASIYSGFVLWVYDFVVLVFTNYWAWRISTKDVLLPFFDENIGENAHLDVGVGTGYYLEACSKHLQELENVSLLDLNPATLQAAKSRLRAAGHTRDVTTFQQSIFSPLPKSCRSKFDSVSMFYLLHCLPGNMPDKTHNVLESVIPTLKQSGVVYGSTVLGQGVTHNWLGNRLMALYNKKGIFDNYNDDRASLEQCLKARFEKVETKLIGVVLLFEARNLKQ